MHDPRFIFSRSLSTRVIFSVYNMSRKHVNSVDYCKNTFIGTINTRCTTMNSNMFLLILPTYTSYILLCKTRLKYGSLKRTNIKCRKRMNVLTHTHKEKKTINNELNVSFNVCLYVCWCVKDEYFVAICALLQT